MKNAKVKIAKRALVQRINRVLAKDGEKLKRTRGARAELDLGDYFIVDTQRNIILHHHLDLEELGRELEALMPYEKIDE